MLMIIYNLHVIASASLVGCQSMLWSIGRERTKLERSFSLEGFEWSPEDDQKNACSIVKNAARDLL